PCHAAPCRPKVVNPARARRETTCPWLRAAGRRPASPAAGTSTKAAASSAAPVAPAAKRSPVMLHARPRRTAAAAKPAPAAASQGEAPGRRARAEAAAKPTQGNRAAARSGPAPGAMGARLVHPPAAAPKAAARARRARLWAARAAQKAVPKGNRTPKTAARPMTNPSRAGSPHAPAAAAARARAGPRAALAIPLPGVDGDRRTRALVPPSRGRDHATPPWASAIGALSIIRPSLLVRPHTGLPSLGKSRNTDYSSRGWTGLSI